ncbi:MAG TPA: HAD family hydrolase [Ktedonobacteraceae bacterium]|nr:HAD family hydrolase [Ktedonobacteraceae bacterium]
MTPHLAFLLDVDNTLLANDEVKQELDRQLQETLGHELTRRFWNIYEQVRHEQDVVDIPLSLKRLRAEIPLTQLDERAYQHAHALFETFPFFEYLYPHAIETLQHLRTLGLTIIVSDGDQYFQEEKIVNSHLAAAVEGRVLIYTHKQQHLDEILQRYPADHYVMIDDKASILAASKELLGRRLTTLFVRQGKYAQEPLPAHFTPDISVEDIADLRNFSAEQFLQT